MTAARAMVAATICVLVLSSPARAQVTATADRTTISVDETVNLEVDLGDGGGRVGSPEGDDFVVIGHSTFQRMEIAGGRTIQRTTTTLTLRPTRVGELTIGRIPVQTSVGLVYTTPIDVVVTERQTVPEPPAGPSESAPVRPTRAAEGSPPGPSARRPPPEPLSGQLFSGPLPRVQRGEPFILATVTAADPYVGQQVLVDYVLFTPASALGVEGIELTEPEFSGSWFMDITESRAGGLAGRLGTRRVGAELYEAQVLRSYLLFPLEAGEVVVAPIRLDLAFRGFARSAGRRVVESAPLALDVQEPPDEGRPAAFSAGNVGDYEFGVTVDDAVVRVGDAVRLTLVAHGAGLMSRVRLPDAPELDGARTYPPDDSHVQDVGPDLWLRGSARREITIVPTREGTLTIPAITFASWDPWTAAYRQRSSEPVTIQVGGVNPNATVAMDGQDQPTDDDWLASLPPLRPIAAGTSTAPAWYRRPVFVVAAVAPPLAWLVVVAASGFVRRRRETDSARRARTAARRARAAIDQGNPAAIAAALRSYLEDVTVEPVRGLTIDRVRALVRRTAGPAAADVFGDALEAAERARYGGQGGADLRASALEAVQRVEDGR